MNISPVGPGILTVPGKIARNGTLPTDNASSFQNTVKKFVREVNGLQQHSEEMVKHTMAGEITDIHEVMVAVEEANIALNLMLEIRNRALEAYQEMMRMPV